MFLSSLTVHSFVYIRYSVLINLSFLQCGLQVGSLSAITFCCLSICIYIGVVVTLLLSLLTIFAYLLFLRGIFVLRLQSSKAVLSSEAHPAAVQSGLSGSRTGKILLVLPTKRLQ